MNALSTDGKGHAAAAGRCGIGVFNLKKRAGQIFEKIKFRPAHEIERDGVDHDLGPVAGKADIVLPTGRFQGERILKPGTAAARDPDA